MPGLEPAILQHRQSMGVEGRGTAELFLGLFYIRHDDTGVGETGSEPRLPGAVASLRPPQASPALSPRH